MPVVEPGDPLALGRFNAITTALTPPAALLKKYPRGTGTTGAAAPAHSS
jgi:hypothetical protein